MEKDRRCGQQGQPVTQAEQERASLNFPGSLVLSGKEIVIKNLRARDFPGGPAVKNTPSNAGDAGSIPGWGTKIPHAVGQLSQCTATTEPARHN